MSDVHELVTECFIYHAKPGHGAAYEQLHSEVWPEAEAELRAAGYVKYQIFRRDDLIITFAERDPRAIARSIPENADRLKQWHDLIIDHLDVFETNTGETLDAHPIYELPLVTVIL